MRAGCAVARFANNIERLDDSDGDRESGKLLPGLRIQRLTVESDVPGCAKAVY